MSEGGSEDEIKTQRLGKGLSSGPAARSLPVPRFERGAGSPQVVEEKLSDIFAATVNYYCFWFL
jgi:hypothetical protein